MSIQHQWKISVPQLLAGMPARYMFILLLLGAFLCWRPHIVQAQVNFQPVERGEYEEVEERLLILKGVEADAEFSAWLRTRNNNELRTQLEEKKGSSLYQDLRFGLRTVVHPDVSINMILQLGDNALKSNDLRSNSNRVSQRQEEAPDSGVALREAWLQYDLNPRSPVYIGKQHLAIGGNRGAVFDAVIPAITFGCQAKSWCVPFGMAFLGNGSSDIINHISLRYTFWDEAAEGGRKRRLVNEFLQFSYSENNIPLGHNFGPNFFNASSPHIAADNPNLVADNFTDDDGNTLEVPIYYDVKDLDIFGFQLEWENPRLNLRLQVLSAQGDRVYHPYRQPKGGYEGQTLFSGEEENLFSYKGSFYETEFTVFFNQNELVLQAMNASGDEYQDPAANDAYARAMEGYYEIVPGSYRGSPLFFNGSGPSFYDGGGLGHSVNNVRMSSLGYRWLNPDKPGFLFSMTAHGLSYNNPILNALGSLVSDIGTEFNIKWQTPLRHQAFLVMELNHIAAEEAFRLRSQDAPVDAPDDFTQGIVRFVYGF